MDSESGWEPITSGEGVLGVVMDSEGNGDFLGVWKPMGVPGTLEFPIMLE